MVRPHDDLRDHDELPDPQETIHFLRQSNDQWQATAERIARQRDEAIAVVKAVDYVVSDSGMDDRDRTACAANIIDTYLRPET